MSVRRHAAAQRAVCERGGVVRVDSWQGHPRASTRLEKSGDSLVILGALCCFLQSELVLKSRAAAWLDRHAQRASLLPAELDDALRTGGELVNPRG